ncbi:hypothetical protein [uncultured Bacteroides sp.]|nr:hypothetical protein [uncultured Bacteroides sp.]
MRDELEEKKEWITPEIIDLDVEKTGKGDYDPDERFWEPSTIVGPS